MLKFLSKRQRSRNVLLYGFIFLMVVGLIGFFSVAVSGEKGLFGGSASNDSTIAKVVGYRLPSKNFGISSRSLASKWGRAPPVLPTRRVFIRCTGLKFWTG